MKRKKGRVCDGMVKITTVCDGMVVRLVDDELRKVQTKVKKGKKQ